MCTKEQHLKTKAYPVTHTAEIMTSELNSDHQYLSVCSNQSQVSPPSEPHCVGLEGQLGICLYE